MDADILLDPAFRKLRAEADDWHEARTEFMLSRLNAGQLPEIDPRFWDGFDETPAPGLPTKSVPDAFCEQLEFRQRVAFSVIV